MSYVLVCFVTVSGLLATAQTPASSPQGMRGEASAAERQRAGVAYGRLPLSFEPNRGQTQGTADFVSRGSGYAMFLNSTETVLSLRGAARPRRKSAEDAGPQMIPSGGVLRMRLLGANKKAEFSGEDLQTGKSNYFIGNDPKQWRTDIPNYGRVRYHGIYKGIDLVYYGNHRRLEHDFEVAPGADPRRIRLAFEGASALELEKSGDVVLRMSGGDVHLRKPVIYQQDNGARREIAGGYVLRGKQVGIEVGEYDRNQTLVIDPILAYSTYIGGTGEDFGSSVAVDGNGNIYLAGYSASNSGFPPAGVPAGVSTTCGGVPNGCSTAVGADDAFIIKLNSSFVPQYGTFIGGNNDDEAYSIAVDGSGNAYITGFTNSNNFPGALNSPLQSFMGNAFVTEVNAAGNSIAFSTLIGGTARDFGQAIAVDNSGNIYLNGISLSSDFPAIGPAITTPPPVINISTNGGTSWTAPTTGPTALDIKAVVVDRLSNGTGGNPGTLYAGAIGGVYKSIDSGATWSRLPISAELSFNTTQVPGDFVQALAIVPSISQGLPATLYAGSRFFGVQRSTDGGSTWTQITSGLANTDVLSLAVNPNNTSQVFAGTSGGGVFMSSNADTTGTWTQLTTSGLSNNSSRTVNSLVYDKTTNTLYAGTNNGVFQNVAPGVASTWNSFSTGLTNTRVIALADDQTGSPNLYAATFGGGLFKTPISPFTTWTSANGSGGTAIGTLLLRTVAVDPSNSAIIYAGGRNGLFKSTNSGGAWSNLNTTGMTSKAPYSIAVDPANGSNLYVGMGNHMSFLAILAQGGSVTYAAQFGGTSGVVEAYGLAVDGAGNIYHAGATVAQSMPGPFPAGAPTTIAGPNFDGFVAKINLSNSPTPVVWDRLLGSPESDDFITGVAVDGSGKVYVTGYTAGTFPVTGTAYQTTLSGPVGVADDVFLTKLDSTGANLLYSTYFGGTGDDLAYSLALMPTTGQVAVAGESTSFDIPGGNGQSLNQDGDTGLLAAFDTTKSGAASLINWSFLGGRTSNEYINSVAVDGSGNLYMTGTTWSTDFPTTTGALQTVASTAPDAFFSKLSSNGNTSDLQLSMTKNVGGVVFAGQPYTYTITVHNLNSSPTPSAANVAVEDLLPSVETFSSVTSSQGSCFNNQLGVGMKVKCSLGALASGASATVTLTVSANPSAGQVTTTFTNIAYASTDDDDPDPTNNSIAIGTTVLTQADLQISSFMFSQSPAGTVTPNTLVTYNVTVYNAGPNSISGSPALTLTDVLPSGFTFVTGANCSGSTTVTCTLPNLGANTSFTFSYQVNVGSSTGTFPHNLSVSTSAASDPVSSNNSMTVATTVANGNSDLQLTGPFSVSGIVGGTVPLVFTVKNNGPNAASGFTLTMTLPSGLSLVNSSSSGPITATCSAGNGIVTCSTPTVASSFPATQNVTVRLAVTTNLQGAFSSQATVSGADFDPNTGNNGASTTITFAATTTNNLNQNVALGDNNSGVLLSLSDLNLSSGPSGPPLLGGAQPFSIRVAPNGRLAYIGYNNSSYISVFDMTVTGEVRRIPLPGNSLGVGHARGLALSPDGSKLIAVGRDMGDEIFIIDTTTFAVTPVSLDGQLGDSAGVHDISIESAVVVGTRAYLNPTNGNQPIVVVDFSSTPVVSTVAGTTGFGNAPNNDHSMAIAHGNTVLAARGANVLSISTATNTLSHSVTIPNGPARGIAVGNVSGSGTYAFVADDNNGNELISVIDLVVGSSTFGQIRSTTSTGVGFAVRNMSLSPDNNTLVVVSANGSIASLSTPLLVGNSPGYIQSSTTLTGVSLRSMDISYTPVSAPPGAPVIDDVNPRTWANDSAQFLRITGSNFQNGALVRIGSMDPLPATFVSANEIQVTVPKGAPAQTANIIVTNPNSSDVLPARYVSSKGNSVRITTPAGFSPAHAVVSSNFYNLSTIFKDATNIPTGPLPEPLTLAPDGSSAYYTAQFIDASLLNITSLDSLSAPLGGIQLTGVGVTFNTSDGPTATDPVTGKKVAYYISLLTTGGGLTGTDALLTMVDIDPASGTRNTVLNSISANMNDANFGEGLAVTPNGNFVYAVVNACNTFVVNQICTSPVTHLLIFNTQAGTVTNISDITAIGANASQQHLLITTDGSTTSLLMNDPNGNVVVYDITGGPLTGSSSPMATLQASLASAVSLSAFQVAGQHMYAIGTDPNGNASLQAFNFVRSPSPIFGHAGSIAVAPDADDLRVDGNLLYVTFTNQDLVGVFDASQVAASNSSALITNIATGIAPQFLAVSSRGSTTADVAVCAASASTSTSCVSSGPAFMFNGQAFAPFTVKNLGPSTATGLTFTTTLPAGVTLTTAYSITDGAQTDLPILCTGTTTVTCALPNLGVYDSNFQSPQANIFLGVTPTTSSPLTITGTIATASFDPVAGNNAANISLNTGADLQVTVDPFTDPVAVGGQVTYVIRVTNNGPQNATNVTAGFFSALQPSSAVASQGSCSFGSCSLGAINSGATATITVTATITNQAASSATNGSISSTVFVSDATAADPNPGNNTLDIVSHLVAGASPSEFWFAGDFTGHTMSLFRTSDNSQVMNGTSMLAIPTGPRPTRIVMAPNRHLAFSPHVSEGANYVSVVDTTIQQEIQRIYIDTKSQQWNVAITPAGDKLLVAASGADTVDIVDLTHFPYTISQRVNLNGLVGDNASMTNDIQFRDVVIAGNKAYISAFVSPGNAGLNVIVVDLGTLAVSTVANTSKIGFLGSQSGLAVLPDGSAVVGVGADDVNPDQLFLINTSTSAVSTLNLPVTDSLTSGTLGVVASPVISNPALGYVAYFDNSGVHLEQVNLTSLLLGNTVTAINSAPLFGMAINSAGTRVLVGSDNASIFSGQSYVVDTGLLASNPNSSVIATLITGFNNTAISAGSADLVPEPGAPTVSDIEPRLIFNNVANTVTVTGSGFQSGATVKIGPLDPIVANVVSPTQLTVTIPAGVQTHGDDLVIIVTNPNFGGALQSQVVSGALDFNTIASKAASFQILSPFTFQPRYEVAVSTAGDDNISILHWERRQKGVQFLQPGLFRPQGGAYSFDGSILYVPTADAQGTGINAALALVSTTSFNNNPTFLPIGISSSPVNLNVGTADVVRVANYPPTGRPAAYLANGLRTNTNPNKNSLLLHIVDADQSAPTANTYIDGIDFPTTNLVAASTLGVSSDGRYVYVFDGNDQQLVIFDVTTRTTASATTASLGVGSAQKHVVVTPDNKSLLLQGPAGQIMVFDISGGNVMSPTLIPTTGTIAGSTPAGMNAPFFGNFVVTGNFLYGFDASQNLVEVFSYNRSNNTFGFLNYFVISGHTGVPGRAGMVVTPDGKMLYVAMESEDAVAVLDANKLATSGTQNDPTVYLTKMGTGLAPGSMAINPVPLDNIGIDQQAIISHAPTSVTAGSDITYTITVKNNSPYQSNGGGMVITLDPHLIFKSSTLYDPNNEFAQFINCSGTQQILCDFGGQKSSQNCNGSNCGDGLPANFTNSIQLVATTTTTGPVTTSVGVAGEDFDPIPANNTAADTTTVAPNASTEADLQVIATAVAGSPNTYTATVTNLGPAIATNVVITDLLDGYGLGGASSPAGICTFTAPTVSCGTLSSLGVNATVTMTVSVTPPTSGWAANVFHATATELDPNPTNNAVRISTGGSVNTQPGTNIMVTGSDATAGIGGNVVFDTVTGAGQTTIGAMVAPLPPPPGYRNGLAPLVFDISTTATYAGGININLQYPTANFHHPAKVRLFHFEGSTWVDRTSMVNVASGIISGRVTSLSPFTLVEPLNNPPVANAGAGYNVNGVAAGTAVSLDGSGSSDADADPLSYRWSGPFAEGKGVVFGIKPTVTLPVGVNTVSLVVNDGEADSPAVSVNVAVSDFTLKTASSSVVLQRGQSASYTLSVGSLYGTFGAPVNLACSSPSADVSCSISTNSVTPGSGGATATLTITANNKTAMLHRRGGSFLALWLGTLPLFGIVLVGAKRRRGYLLGVLLVIALLMVHVGCGGGGTQSSTQTTSSASASTVVLTVSGTSQSLTHSTTLTVTMP
ncbi:MAG: SBBP repeat-containing protein [Terriglobales bacterium]